MRIGAIVQARMGSQRFPGKVLHRVADKPMMQYVLERLRQCNVLDCVIVATSSEVEDAPIARFCEEQNVTCHRGRLVDVAGRFKDVLDAYPLDGFVRTCADSPLIDPCLIEECVTMFMEDRYDLVTNVLERTFPSGQSVEVLRADTFRSAYSLMRDPEDFEHVTRFFYKNPTRFRISNLRCPSRCNGIHLSVDTAGQMQIFAAMVAKMDRPHWEYGLEEIVRIYREVAPSAS